MTEADLARDKLDLLHDRLRKGYPADDRIWALIAGIRSDIDRLEKRAYFFVPKPRTLWRRLRRAAA